MWGGKSNKPSNDLFPKATAVIVSDCVPLGLPHEHGATLGFFISRALNVAL